MKFKVLKTSSTGKRFEAIKQRADKCLEAQKELVGEFGVTRFRQAHWVAWGGISCVFFDKIEEVDSSIWKVEADGFYPKRRTKSGKALAKRFEDLPTVMIGDLNACINYDSAFNNVGVSFSHDKYILIDVNDDFNVDKMPKDCKEITVSAYKALKNEMEGKI